MDPSNWKKRLSIKNTYGKSTHKRISLTQHDDIFVKRDASTNSSSSMNTVKKAGDASTVAAALIHTSKPDKKDGQDKKDSQEKKDVQGQLPHDAPIAAATSSAARARKARKLSPSTILQDEDSTDKAAAAQLQQEQQEAARDELRLYDMPCDSQEDSEPVSKYSSKRKRVPSKSTSKPTGTAAKARAIPTAEQHNKAPPTSKPSRASWVKPDKPTGPKPSKSTITITGKPPTNSNSPTPTEKRKAPAAADTSALAKHSFETSAEKESVPPGPSSVTPLQSKRPISKPKASGKSPTPSVQQAVTPGSAQNRASAPQAPKGKVDKPPPPPQPKRSIPGSQKSIPEAMRPEKNVIEKPKAAERSKTGTKTVTSLPIDERITPSARPRKRLIDALQAKSGRRSRRRKSTSPKDSIQEGFNTGSIFQLGSSYHRSPSPPQSRSIIESQNISESQQSTSQEVKITIQRQFGNPTGAGGPRITYGRERSYKADESIGSLEAFLLNMPALPGPKSTKPKRRILEHHPKPPNDEAEEGNNRGEIISSHELRVSGEHCRFLDDIEEFFSDIEGTGSLDIRCSGYFWLAKKLNDRIFSQKFRSSSFDERLLSRMDQPTDEVICFALSHHVLTLLRYDTTPRIMLHVYRNGVISMLAKMLCDSRDIALIAKDKPIWGVDEFRQLVAKSEAFSGKPTTVISPQIMALKVLDKLIRDTRARGSVDEILSTDVLHGLVDLVTSFSKKPQYPKVFETHGLQLLKLPLSILEAYSMGGYGSLDSQVSENDLALLGNLVPAILGWTCEEDLGAVLFLLLRLLINVTHNRPVACEQLAASRLIVNLVALCKEKFEKLDGVLEEQDRLLSVDLLILSLALMFNLSEFSSTARNVFDDRVVYSIEGNPYAIDVLLDIFLDRLKRVSEAESIQESQKNVAFGYLAVLLGRLCQEAPMRYKAFGKFPDSNLKCLMGAIGEFVAHHRKVDQTILGSEDGEYEYQYQEEPNQFTARLEKEDPNQFTARLENVMVQLRAFI
ncbi:wings apart-like protein regulation of heterochromatin-domain-containing protein [Sphaerosporella brunnea]|uniref:Wings apart-like protein regulation of heterochromatin-domain-containing protein n=1 Tax=Sphaerosporella brunnea TaxID=1250544 RepID=A0A5J5ESV2_9PEZI|nr:wings apart-like protein regulation of heterochromatin-domain-containing protein [Sphaerosporella brunnea]